MLRRLAPAVARGGGGGARGRGPRRDGGPRERRQARRARRVAGRDGDRRARRRRDPAGRAAAGLRPPARARRRLPRAAAGERELQHARAAEMLAGSGRSPADQVASQLLCRRAAGDARSSGVLRERRRPRCAAGAPESAVAYLQPGARRAALRRGPARRCCSSSGSPRSRSARPTAVEHLRGAYESLHGPASARARAARLLARTLLFTGQAPEAAHVIEVARAELPAGHEDLRWRSRRSRWSP